MQLQGFMIDVGQWLMRTAAESSLAACIGFVFGSSPDVNDPILYAKVAVIASLAKNLFSFFVEHGNYTDKQKNEKYLCGLVCGTIAGVSLLEQNDLIAAVDALFISALGLLVAAVAGVAHFHGHYVFVR